MIVFSRRVNSYCVVSASIVFEHRNMWSPAGQKNYDYLIIFYTVKTVLKLLSLIYLPELIIHSFMSLFFFILFYDTGSQYLGSEMSESHYIED